MSYYQLIIKITISEKRRIAKLWKKEKIALNTYKGGVNILRPPRLLPAIRRQKHKSKRASARTWLQLWMWLVDLNYNFECDWLIELSDNKLSNNKLSDNNLASELVENRSF